MSKKTYIAVSAAHAAVSITHGNSYKHGSRRVSTASDRLHPPVSLLADVLSPAAVA